MVLREGWRFGGRLFCKRGHRASAQQESLHEEIPHDVSHICVRDEGGLAQISFPFPVFLLEDVAFPLFATQNLAGASHFKALGDGRSGFGLTSFASHGSGVLGGGGSNARFFVRDPKVFLGTVKFLTEGQKVVGLRKKAKRAKAGLRTGGRGLREWPCELR